MNKKSKKIIPLAKPWINSADKKAILESLKSSHLTDGPLLRQFEANFASFTGAKYAIGVSNATAALHLSLLADGIGKDDEVIIPDMTFVATANAVIQAGAVPVLADIGNDLNIDVTSIEQKITKKTRALIPVHFAGLPCNMKSIKKIASKHNLTIIEDCAHAIGAFYDKKHVGNFGLSGCFSFYPVKNFTTIEGGMIITNSIKIRDACTSLRNHGLTKTLIQRNNATKPWIYDMSIPGFNFRLDEVRSALGLSQLRRFMTIQKKRKNAAKFYNSNLKDISGLELVNSDNSDSHVYHLYVIRITDDFPHTRDEIHEKLNEQGIKTTVHYKPIHKFSYFKNRKLCDSRFPNATKAYKECLSLPLFSTITKKEQKFVCDVITSLSRS